MKHLFKVIQIWCGPRTDIYKKYEVCMDQTKKFFEDNGYEYIRIIKEESEYGNFVIDTDTMRMELATENPQMLYIDCDIVFYKVPIFDKEGIPYFDKRDEYNFNECLFYVNDCCDFFKSVFAEKERRNIGYVYGWPNKIIRSKKCHVMDKTCYEHYLFTNGDRK